MSWRNRKCFAQVSGAAKSGDSSSQVSPFTLHIDIKSIVNIKILAKFSFESVLDSHSSFVIEALFCILGALEQGTFQLYSESPAQVISWWAMPVTWQCVLCSDVIVTQRHRSTNPSAVMCGNIRTRYTRLPVAQTPNIFCLLVISSDSAHCFKYRCLSVIYDFVGMIYNARATALMGKCLIK